MKEQNDIGAVIVAVVSAVTLLAVGAAGILAVYVLSEVALKQIGG